MNYNFALVIASIMIKFLKVVKLSKILFRN